MVDVAMVPFHTASSTMCRYTASLLFLASFGVKALFSAFGHHTDPFGLTVERQECLLPQQIGS
jgi:hypothetical protein